MIWPSKINLDAAYFSWKLRVLDDGEIERAPALDFTHSTWQQDEVFLLFGGLINMLFEITKHDLPQHWEIEFERGNAFGLSETDKVELQYGLRQRWIERFFCLLINGGRIKRTDGRVMVCN